MVAPVHGEKYEIRSDGQGSVLFGSIVVLALGAVVFNMVAHWGEETVLVVRLFFWAFGGVCVLMGVVGLAVLVRTAAVPEYRVDAAGFHAPNAKFHAPWSEIALIEVGTVEVYHHNHQQPRASGYRQRQVFWVQRGELVYEFQMTRDHPIPLVELERALTGFAGQVPVQVRETVERRMQWTRKP
ncbi:hypothetical protein ACIRBX_24130 [Kitasatospora sp. NPDC096147]|uniref:hypothetical protein n=1 Tax=Kitasatospora sp. NPDC096147 TaxID=3364093 RepID=UPI0037F2B9C7